MARDVGLRQLQVADSVQGATIPVTLLYPTDSPPETIAFGPYTVYAARDAPVSGGRLPLVVISHGNSGSPWTLHGLAAHLARAGFAAAMPEHIGNSRSDNSLDGTIANLENRPRHVTLAIDAAFADRDLGPRLVPGSVGVAGLSIGGYTALAAAGGRPWTGPHESPDGKPRPVAAERDPRIRALVLLSPATPWLMAQGALADVGQPILMRTGDRDAITPPWHAEIVKRGVPDPSRVEHEVVAGAGHFSLMSPFPPSMTRPDFPPSQDPDGFDRAAYQPVLYADVEEFLRRTLSS